MLDVAAPLDHAYVNGAVPPETLAFTEAIFPFEQVPFCPEQVKVKLE